MDKAAIAFTVSKAKETFKMPDLVGMTEAEAKAQITKLNLKLPVNGITREKSYKVAKGKVIKQFPFDKNQDVSVGSEISLVISDGLPEDAGQLTVSLPVKPTTEGKDSEFKIVVSDAQYENFEYLTEKVSKPQNLDVKVIVSPDKKAVILIKEGDNLVNSITRTYQDYLDQKNGKTVSPSPSRHHRLRLNNKTMDRLYRLAAMAKDKQVELSLNHLLEARQLMPQGYIVKALSGYYYVLPEGADLP